MNPTCGCTTACAVAMLAIVLTASSARAQEACCFTDGTCEELLAADCTNAGGMPRGGGTTCDTVICPASTDCSEPALAIPDHDPAGASDSIVVAGDGQVADANVYILLSHTWVGDLTITLSHDDTATTAIIYDRPGVPDSTFGCGRDDIEIVLDDEADDPIEDECGGGTPTQFGFFIPSEALSAFDGEDVAGTWTLNVSDSVAPDVGTLHRWCLIFDTDGDGIPDAVDVCPGFDDLADADGDAVPDGCDVCFGDNGIGDSDGDGECDDLDGCPNDGDKTDPGVCGCGNSDDDSDGDGVPDCFDACPNDGNKLSPGICGCGNPDVDSDGDGWLDCLDNCPSDANSNQADENGDGVGDACTPPPAGQDNPCAPQAMMMPMAAMLLLTFVQRRRRRRGARQSREQRAASRRGTRLFVLVGLLAAFMNVPNALAQPANDLCADAIGPLDVPSNTIGTTLLATDDADFMALPNCGTSLTAPGVWYTVIGTGNTMTATTCDGGVTTNYDTKLHVFCSCTAMICVGGNDDQAGGFDPACDVLSMAANRGSTVAWCSEPGAIYLILVSGFSNATGNFELTISDDGVACGAPTAECDADGDGVTNGDDNCPNTPNADQANSDGDALGDVCDNCPNADNQNQADGDGDGIGNACDVCPGGDDADDADGDGVCDNLDNCPNDPEKTSPGACGCGTSDDDSDGDGVPDCFDGCPNDGSKLDGGVCGCGNADVDTDGDGWLDCVDNCPDTPNGDQADVDGDGVGNACVSPPAGQGNPCAPMGMMMAMTPLMLLTWRRKRGDNRR